MGGCPLSCLWHFAAFVTWLQSNRLDYEISFSARGGVSIEEHWDQVQSIKVEAAAQVSGGGLWPGAPLCPGGGAFIRPLILLLSLNHYCRGSLQRQLLR